MKHNVKKMTNIYNNKYINKMQKKIIEKSSSSNPDIDFYDFDIGIDEMKKIYYLCQMSNKTHYERKIYLQELINDYYDFSAPFFQKFDEWLIIITKYLLLKNIWLEWQDPYVKINNSGNLNISVKQFRDYFIRGYNRFFTKLKNKYSQIDNSDLLLFNTNIIIDPEYTNIHKNKLYNSGYNLAQYHAHILGLGFI